MPQPFVELALHPWRLRVPEVRLPAQQVASEFRRDLVHAATTITLGHPPYALLESHYRLAGDGALDFAARRPPKAVAEKLPSERARHRTLGVYSDGR